MYYVQLWEGNRQLGNGNFRVEEYKKPEYEVTVEAPKEPIMLGEKVTAMINARYYFGAPVANAKVKYKVLRTASSEQWYPICPWDWMYGPGYWWFAYDYQAWYARLLAEWGCRRPHPWWGYRAPVQPPEVVADAEGQIQPDGTLPVLIDTAAAKELHPGDQDHKFQITAEVTDESRRTIVGTGQVMVARKPFKVFAWVDPRLLPHRRRRSRPVQRPHARQEAGGRARARSALLKISYETDPKTGEARVQGERGREVGRRHQRTGHGQAAVQGGRSSGQYRLSYKLTDDEEAHDRRRLRLHDHRPEL